MFFLPHRGNNVIRWYTISICLLKLLLTTYVFCYHFQLDDPLIQLEHDLKWIIFFDFHWRLGIDGISIGPILLTEFISTLATLSSRPVTRDSRLFHFLMLAMYSGQIGPFPSRDLLLFFLSCRRGSIFLLMGVLGMGLYASNEPTLNFETLANQSYPVALEIIFYFGFLIAYAVKSPIIPLHTWLPDTHGEAHYSTCMLLAGILKMGAYGLVRINMELLPHAHSLFSPWLIIVGTGQIIYAALTSPGQRNLKKRIAYSSVSHMGFTIIGIASVTDMGLNGAILQIISHGFIGAALFFLAGTSYDRIRLFLDGFSCIAGNEWFCCRIGNLYWHNYHPQISFNDKNTHYFCNDYWNDINSYLFIMYVTPDVYGYKQFNAKNSYFFDSGPRELFVSICIFLPVIGIGIYPDFVLSLSSDKVEAILSNYFSR
ncbi:hypothetical protein C5167_029529 [Papaver somniferum]|nr:hypothetical protein C5167_029529 [Papaver somniferum]